jgi:putative membrane-bound dehydrogenase-like protein
MMTIRRFLPAIVLLTPALAVPETQPLADGLTRTLVAREPLLKNPVVVSVDVDGSLYVAETARRQLADLDIREFKDWIPESLALRSVDERQALYHKIFAPGKGPQGSVKDHNHDGVVDVKDLTAISEKILRLTDTDGDGVMDKSQVFAENFNSEVTGIAAGVLAWRGDVYAAIIPDVWKLRDTLGAGTADRREALLTGFGVHIAYAGHDMHGLCLGPDGKIYWTIGDKGVNVLSKEGKRWQAQDCGSVMRCNPDGTGFEIFARGIRNVQQIAFDDDGNIFGVDNDSDAKGEKERFVYIAEDSDTGWRCYYQYRGPDYNPWMAESLSVPSGKDQPAYITPALCNYIDGPAGFAHDPGTALNERYRGSFFVTGFPAGLVYSFKAEPNGAGFRMTDSHVVDKGPAYVGCNFGPDGALYLADWSGGYPLKEKGAVWKIDDTSVKDSAIRREVAAMLKAGPAKLTDAELIQRLKHADQRIRCDAQWELARRPSGAPLLETSAATWKDEDPRACTHALWGLTQAKRFSPGLLKILLTAKAGNTRAQAAKWAGETAGVPVPELIPLLHDASAMVRYRAAVAISKLGMNEALDEVLAMLAENDNHDAYLRHAGVLALTAMKPEAAVKAAKHPSPAIRLAAAIAFRRQGSPEAASLLDDADPAIAAEAARSIYDDTSIIPALPALAAALDRNGLTAPAALRAIATNRVVADAACAARLSAYAADAARPEDLRIAALQALASWPVKLALDPVDGRWHPAPSADATVARAAFAAAAPALEHDPLATISKAAGETAKALGITRDPKQLMRDAVNSKNPPELRLQSLAALKVTSPEMFEQVAGKLMFDFFPIMRRGAASLVEPADALDYALIAVVADSTVAGAARAYGEVLSTDTEERQNAVTIIGKCDVPQAIAGLKSLAAHFDATPELQLEILDALAGKPELKTELDSINAALAAKGELGSSLPELSGGDAARGKLVFETNLAASCTACHRIGETGSNVGPPLTEVGKKGREYLLESLILPQAKIAPGYGMKSVVKKDGTTVSGAPKSESAEGVVLLQPDGSALSIPAAEIASQTPAVSPMPPMGALLKPAEIRDLIEFLSTCN